MHLASVQQMFFRDREGPNVELIKKVILLECFHGKMTLLDLMLF